MEMAFPDIPKMRYEGGLCVKKKIRQIAALLLLACCLSGCTFWMNGYDYSVTPHVEEDDNAINTMQEVNTFDDLYLTLSDLVEAGRDSCVLYVSGFSEAKLEKFMDIIVHNLRNLNAIGSYSIEEINYEIGTKTGRQAVAFEVTYNRTRSEILRIKRAEDMKEAKQLITTALDKCDAKVVLYVSNYEAIDFTQMVQDYVDENPGICMEMPQIAIGLYPNTGTERVIELTFTYQNSREDLRSMQEKVRPIFSSAELYVSGDGESFEKYAQLYSFLMERFEYKIETSITPAYSLLRHGVGDSKAFAVVYASMCQNADLNCKVVSGTRGGEPRYWNALKINGMYYYVDLLQCNSEGNFSLKTERDMAGYVWDYSAFESRLPSLS